MPSRSIIVGLGAEIARFRKDFEEAHKETKKFRARTESVFKGLGVAVAGYFSFRAITEGLREINSFISDVTAAAGEEELAQKKLATALGYTSKELINYTNALQEKTAYDNDAITGAMALIAAFTKSEDATRKATVATLDLASGAGMQLKDAANLVSKTVGSTTNALSRYGITVEGAVGSTERLKSLMDGISKVYGGQAAAEVETYYGKVKQLKNAWGDTRKEVGRIFTANTFMVQSLGYVKKGIEDLGKWLKANQREMQEWVKGAVLFGADAVIGFVKVLDSLAAGYDIAKNSGVAMYVAYKQLTLQWTQADADNLAEWMEGDKKRAASRKALIAELEAIRKKMAATAVGDASSASVGKGAGKRPAIGDTSDELAKAMDSEIKGWTAIAEARIQLDLDLAKVQSELLKQRTDEIEKYQQMEVDGAVASAEAIIQANEEEARAISDILRERFKEQEKDSKALQNFVVNGFNDMADAVAAFVTTGKLNFRSFVDSAISDLARLLTKMSMFKLLESVGLGAWVSPTPIPGRAAGGPVSAMTPYIVGERGPELFVPSTSGSIVPGGKGGNVTVNIRNESGQPVAARTASASVDPSGWVIDVVLDGLQRNRGGLRTALGGA